MTVRRIVVCLWAALAAHLQFHCCTAWLDSALPKSRLSRRSWLLRSTSSTTEELLMPKEHLSTTKSKFLRSLDHLDRMNEHNLERTELLERLVANKVEVPVEKILEGYEMEEHHTTDCSIQQPGKWDNMQKVAAGDWKVIYAPHMTTMAKLFGNGEFQVSYLLNDDGTMTSHARCEFPWLFGQSCLYLSVSGTYGSQSDEVCRVDFDRAWVKAVPNNQKDAEDIPYTRIDDVPNSAWKESISRLGRLFFIKEVSVFPIAYMDDDLIVFDFDLLGTRICASKNFAT